MNATGRPGLREEHRAKLPSSYYTDLDLPPLGRPIAQERVQIQGFPPPYDAFNSSLITMLALRCTARRAYEDRAGSPGRVGGDERMILPYTSGTQENPEGAEAP